MGATWAPERASPGLNDQRSKKAEPTGAGFPTDNRDGIWVPAVGLDPKVAEQYTAGSECRDALTQTLPGV